MGDVRFSEWQVRYLQSLPAVESVSADRIVYSERFKRECMRRYMAGESPKRIFFEAGLPPALIGYKRVERSIARWRRSHEREMDRLEEQGAVWTQYGGEGGRTRNARYATKHTGRGVGDVRGRDDSLNAMLIEELIRQNNRLQSELDDLRPKPLSMA